MNSYLSLKLVIRSWKRNKLFVAISLVSLVVGIACTTLLMAFVIHEYNVENNNPNKNRILRLVQTLPFAQQAVEGTFIYGGTVPQIVSQFPEIESRTQTFKNVRVKIEGQEFQSWSLVAADSTLTAFFPFHNIVGDVQDALLKPGDIAVSELFAKRCFGTTDCIGKNVDILLNEIGIRRIVAVFGQPEQSMMQTDILLPLEATESSDCMLLLKEGTDIKKFRQRFGETELPTLLGNGHLRTQTLQESYFDATVKDSNQVIKHQQSTLLGVGLLSALLILFIGCFNFINLSFSRLLRQVHMLHIESIMGATRSQMRQQLFLDTFLMVLVAFLLSLLLMNDLLPAFNHMVSAKLTMEYLFSWQVFPLILLFIIILSVIPASYMGHRLHSISETNYRHFFTGRKKRFIVALLVTIQFIISIGLMSTFMIIRSQMYLIKQEEKHYENIINVYTDANAQPTLKTRIDEVKNIEGVEAVITSNTGIYPMSLGIPGKDDSGDNLLMLELYEDCPEFLTMHHIELQDSLQIFHLMSRTPQPALINETFVDLLVPEGENPIGQPISKYVHEREELTKGTIIGIVKDFKKYSMTDQVAPLRILLYDTPQDNFSTLVIKVKAGYKDKVINCLRESYEKKNPGIPLKYDDMYQKFMSYNQDITHFSHILFMYACVSIFLTLFGLFGITHYAVSQRKREISIRKIHGASARQILWLINYPFLSYVGIAFVVAVPVIYLFMTYWLQQFAYHATPNAFHFLLPLLFTIGITYFTICLNGYRVAVTSFHPRRNSQ